MAIDLHRDSIADNEPPSRSEGRVRFNPYEGVAPRLFRRVYLKSSELKDSSGQMIAGSQERRSNAILWSKAYTELENEVAEFVERLNKNEDN